MSIRVGGNVIGGNIGTDLLATKTDLNLSNSTAITNCITEIPQDIKLELSNGTLTLKAGSKMYVPNGFEADGTTPKFDVVITEVNSNIGLNTPTGQYMVFWKSTGVWGNQLVSNCLSGTSIPSSFQGMYYRTDTNNLDFYNNSTAEGSNFSLPLAIITASNGSAISIDQVFNGFGYIGSTVFALPGIKGLIPNERNTDGSLKNTEFTIPSIQIYTNPSNFSTQRHYYFCYPTGNSITDNTVYYEGDTRPTFSKGVWYDTVNNLVLYSQNWTSSSPTIYKVTGIMFGYSVVTTGKISDLETKTPFRAVDYNDYQALSNKVDINTSNIALKQDVATAVNYDNISNCITEIPQDIKLELNNGTLTLKAGSKVYVPNGDGVFTSVTINSDLTITSTTATRIEGVLFYRATSNSLYFDTTGGISSGSSASPTKTTWMWYDTTNNKIKRSENTGSTWFDGFSFPLCIFTRDGGQISSIDQVFNGFGYIGSTVFALPGVKGLIPNYRNSDGTLKNTEFTTTSVSTAEVVNGSTDLPIFIDSSGKIKVRLGIYSESNTMPTYAQYMVWYNTDENLMHRTIDKGATWDNRYLCYAGKYKMTDGKIALFIPKNTIKALDYNDSSTIAGWGMPSDRYIDLTLGASGATYTAPANGYVAVSKMTTAQNQNISINCNNFRSFAWGHAASINIFTWMPVNKGDVFSVTYSAGGTHTDNYFRFIYAEGEN